MPHLGTAIADGDDGKLVALLGKAFDGTAQRSSRLPLLYGEYGVETAIPAAKAGAYSGNEMQKTAIHGVWSFVRPKRVRRVRAPQRPARRPRG